MAWPRLVIFDCDGVLVDSEPLAARVMSEVLTELSYALTPQDCIDRFTGVSMATVMARIEAAWGRKLPDDFLATVRARDARAFRTELEPMPGAERMLERLARPTCVASSGAPEKMRLTLSLTGLLRFFEPHLYSAESVARSKPAPDLFLHAAASMGARPAACAVVEDSVAGIEAARAAGMRAIGFAGGGHAGPGYAAMLRKAGAATVLTRLADLLPLFGKGGGGDRG